MQTFITNLYALHHGGIALDNKRLGKQRVECKQILLALQNPTTYGWQNHPAVKMWRGYEGALIQYAINVCAEWQGRGFKDTLLDYFEGERTKLPHTQFWVPNLPVWFQIDEIRRKIVRSHRSNLIRKMPEFYGPMWPQVPDNIPYHWPV